MAKHFDELRKRFAFLFGFQQATFTRDNSIHLFLCNLIIEMITYLGFYICNPPVSLSYMLTTRTDSVQFYIFKSKRFIAD